MRIAWATDVHLNTVSPPAIEAFCETLLGEGVETLLLGGDIAEAQDLVAQLELLDSRLGVPIHFVLGNHDFYGGGVAEVRGRVAALGHPRLRWLPATGRVRLTGGVSLVGHDGWGDCRIGAVDEFQILTDYLAIADLAAAVDRDDLFRGFTKRAPLRTKLRELGDEAAAALRGPLTEAARSDAAVLVVTHVPPFREACWHDGSISEETWLPGFTCQAVGDLLLEVAGAWPDKRFTVLCGHTHSSGYVAILPNLEVHTGRGAYGILFHRLIDVGESAFRVLSPPA